MSEIVLSNSSNHQYVPDYSANTMMSNFNPATMGVQQKDNSQTTSPSQVAYEDNQQHYYHGKYI